MQRSIRLGTRGSPLALAQANAVADALRAAHGLNEEAVEIVVVRTTGDKVQDRPLAEIGGKGLFAKEIEEALLDDRIDAAVHSMKDMETRLPDGLVIDCFLPREDPRDAFLSRGVPGIADLPKGALLGTSSVRRAAQVKAMRPDLQIVGLRGNVGTRLGKLEAGEVDATLLAVAGLKRLDMLEHATAIIEPEDLLPAVAQGVVGVERRVADVELGDMFAAIDHKPTHDEVTMERVFLDRLDGSCRTPIAGLATLDGKGNIYFRSQALTLDGSHVYEASRQGPLADAAQMALSAADEIKAAAGPDLFAA